MKMQDILFRVIGIGHGIERVIGKVKSFGFDGVSVEVVNYPFECEPTDEDRMAIFVFIDCEDNANRIAEKFHEAGVLTIGLSNEANPSCFDSIYVDPMDYDNTEIYGPDISCYERVLERNASKYSEIIKSILQPIVTTGYVSYDFSDLSLILKESGYFSVKRVSGESIGNAVENMQHELNDVSLQDIEQISFNLYLNRESLKAVEMNEAASFSEMIFTFQDTVQTVWSVHFDETLLNNQINLVSILSGKELYL